MKGTKIGDLPSSVQAPVANGEMKESERLVKWELSSLACDAIAIIMHAGGKAMN